MLRAVLAFLSAMLLAALPAHAGTDRQTLGFGRIFTNDALGDTYDRWRTGSYAVSWVRGPAWQGRLPDRAGEILEYRFRAEIIAPASLSRPAPWDRRYAGALSFGVHSHFRRGATTVSLGADLVAIGRMTGLGAFQQAVHDALGVASPAAALSRQLPNSVRPTASAAATREIALGGGAARVLPFVEAQAGVETLLRFGADIALGPAAHGGMWVRDVVTGHRYNAVAGGRGLGAVLGGDVAYVASSAYLPAGGAARLEPVRLRLRAGAVWQGERARLFYGLTWLGREFTGQPNSQVLGSLSLKIRF